ncbi:MAG: ribosome-associated protein [Psychroserpens sp.]|jgi:ribosome-associated protein
MSSNFPLIDVSTQPIELCKLLKIANMVSGGGEAKIVISEGYVLLNNAVEFQKRKKVYHDDIIEFNGDIIQVNVVKLGKDELPLTTKKQAEKTLSKQSVFKKVNNKTNKTDNKPQTAQASEIPCSKRKPISF